MQIIADLHMHSKYSRATSKQLDIANLEKYGKIKGLDLIGTGDFTHPKWIKELKADLVEDGSGILKTTSGFPFVLQTEISLVYTQDGKGRRVHQVVLAPNFEVVDQITEYLLSKGRVDYDGRPIFKIPSPEFVERLKSISNDIEIIPAHIWTPWFGLLGSKSGFDSVKECFQDQTKHIFSLETGLSSDPAMNWRLTNLDKYSLVSNSDSHSFWPWRIGRECNVFDIDLNYKSLIKALHTKEGFKETIEVDPGYGKYHFDGHRNCNVCLEPSESVKLRDICPSCGKPLTIGVLHRIEELADRPEGYELKDAVPFKTLIPLSELISGLLNTGVATQKTWKVFNELISKFGSEYNVLLNATKEELEKVADEKLTETIILNRAGKIKVNPGYDGEYGIPVLGDKKFEKKEIKIKHKQMGLDRFM